MYLAFPRREMKKVQVFILYLGNAFGYLERVPHLDYIPVGIYSICTYLTQTPKGYQFLGHMTDKYMNVGKNRLSSFDNCKRQSVAVLNCLMLIL